MSEVELGCLPLAQADEQVLGLRVGEVAEVAADALLQGDRPLGEVEHLVVVIGLEHEDVGQGDVVADDRGHVAEVGQPGQAFGRPRFFGGEVEREADGIGGVVRDRDRGDLQALELERRTGLEELPVGLGLEGILDAPGGLAVREDLEPRILAEQGGQADAVVGMLVRDENGVQGTGFDAELLQGGLQPRALEARIQHHPRAADLQQGAVAGTAGAEDVEGESHAGADATL